VLSSLPISPSETSNLTPWLSARYDRDASRYHKGVYTRKRADLIAALDSNLSNLFLGQLKNMHKSCLVVFKKELLNGLRGETYDFADVVLKARERCDKTFIEGAKEALVEGTDWTWTEEFELLKEEVRTVADQCRKDETKKMLNLIEVYVLYIGHKGLAHVIFDVAKFQETYIRTCGTGSQQTFSRDVGQYSAALQGYVTES
jgi:Root hair defective 3 GTP-binding protein (RHD3)